MLIEMGKGDVLSRQHPRSYAMWTSSKSGQNYGNKLLIHRTNYLVPLPCHSHQKYICQRPAAALEGSDMPSNSLL